MDGKTSKNGLEFAQAKSRFARAKVGAWKVKKLSGNSRRRRGCSRAQRLETEKSKTLWKIRAGESEVKAARREANLARSFVLENQSFARVKQI
jgi:hypothetical protein